MHAISSYRGNRPTNRQDRLQYTAPQLSVQCNYGRVKNTRHKMLFTVRRERFRTGNLFSVWRAQYHCVEVMA